MTLKYASRVQETSASSGTGNLTLDGATAAFRTINIAFNNDFDATGLPFDYVITSNSNNTWEEGTGKLLTSTSMERTTVINNSDENTSKINFSSGGLVITVTPSRDTLANLELITLIASGAVTAASGAFSGTLSSGNYTIAEGVISVTNTSSDAALSVSHGTSNNNALVVTTTNATFYAVDVTASLAVAGGCVRYISNNAGFNSVNGLVKIVVDNPSASGTGQRIQNDGSGIGADFDTNATGSNSAIKTDVALTSTNFKRHVKIGALSIWESDGATANGNLSGTEGDICLNGGTGTGQCAFCTGTTNWTDM